MAEELIVNFAPTGMIPTKGMTPKVPVSVSEIVEDVHRAWEIGITMVHLHARDPVTALPTCRADVYDAIIRGVRGFAKELVICLSLSGRDSPEFEKRAEPLALGGSSKPDMGSLTLSSLNFNRQASINEPATIHALAARMGERGIAPELEAFDAGMINYAHFLVRKGLIRAPLYFNLLLGNVACAQPDPLHAGIMVRDLPPGSLWSLAGIGRYQARVTSLAIAIGGGVRIGLEDNIWFDRDRTRLAANSDLLRRVHTIAEANERPLMGAAAFRRAMGLEAGVDGRYGLKSTVDAAPVECEATP